MPLYSYRCNKCEYSCKIFHQIGEEPSKCPTCSSEEFKKQFMGSSVKVTSSSETAKHRVEKFIEESRETLKEQLVEARKEYK
jgi:putative FmdB family regulatory protein